MSAIKTPSDPQGDHFATTSSEKSPTADREPNGRAETPTWDRPEPCGEQPGTGLKRRASVESSDLAALESRNGTSPGSRTRQTVSQGNADAKITNQASCEQCKKLNRKVHSTPSSGLNRVTDYKNSVAFPTWQDTDHWPPLIIAQQRPP